MLYFSSAMPISVMIYSPLRLQVVTEPQKHISNNVRMLCVQFYQVKALICKWNSFLVIHFIVFIYVCFCSPWQWIKKSHKLTLICTRLVPQLRSVCCVYEWLTFLCTAASLSLHFDFCVLFSYCTSIRGKETELTYTQTLMGELKEWIHTSVYAHI